MKSALERSHDQPPGCPTSPPKCHITRVYKSTTHLEDRAASPAGAGQRCSRHEGMHHALIIKMLMHHRSSGCPHRTVQPCPAHQLLWHFRKLPQGLVGLQARPWQELQDGWCAPGIPKATSSSRVGWLRSWLPAIPTMASPSVLPGYASCTSQSPVSEQTTQNQEQSYTKEIFFPGG